jgi:hypothetical protein
MKYSKANVNWTHCRSFNFVTHNQHSSRLAMKATVRRGHVGCGPSFMHKAICTDLVPFYYGSFSLLLLQNRAHRMLWYSGWPSCFVFGKSPRFFRSPTRQMPWYRMPPPFTIIHRKVVIWHSLHFFNRASRHEGVLGKWRYSSTHYLTSALDGGEWSASLPGRFTPRERAPDTHWIGGWEGPRAVLDTMVKRKIPSPRRESNRRTSIVQPLAQRYTDWAITALNMWT